MRRQHGAKRKAFVNHAQGDLPRRKRGNLRESVLYDLRKRSGMQGGGRRAHATTVKRRVRATGNGTGRAIYERANTTRERKFETKKER